MSERHPSRTRWVVGVLLLGAVALLVMWWPGQGRSRTQVHRSPIAAAVGHTGVSWYCAARDIGVPSFTHTVYVTAVGRSDASVRVESFGDKGPGPNRVVEVVAGRTQVIDVAASFGSAAQSVLLESSAPVVVEHRLAFPGGADQAPCSTYSGDTWYFPAVSTTRDATARLSLFNPFPSDAAVDIEIGFDTGVRVPPALSGVIVPAGTTKVIELGSSVERREQFSATVRSRSGGVVAQLAQVFNGSIKERPTQGLRLISGSRTGSSSWVFAGGFTDPSASEVVAVYNPHEAPVRVLVQVVPYGGLGNLPEPFEVEVPGLRYATVDMGAESRVPQVGYHAIEVQSRDGRKVVAARVLNVYASLDGGKANPLRKSLSRGTTASAAAMVAAEHWVSTGLDTGGGSTAVLMVHNSGTGIAVVRAAAIDDATGRASKAVRREVAAGDSVMITAAELAPVGAHWSAKVDSVGPVVVERLLVFGKPADISLQPSVPVVGSADELDLLGG